MALITVFTPTYNRAHTLSRTYESLCEQDCKDFIWLIVDDGSTDNTSNLIKQWQQNDNGFEIQYIYKENGGMHTAHNVAYENIHTKLNMCIDSDDKIANGAISKIKKTWMEIKDNDYAGIIGLDADFEGNVIGKEFSNNIKETTLTGYYDKGGSGDKKLVYRTDIINKYPQYPIFEGEKYVGLGYKYILIDQDYKLYVLNEILCNVEYQKDGSSNNMWKQYKNNPNGFLVIRILDMLYPTSIKKLVKACIHYVSSSIIAHKKYVIKNSPRKVLTIILYPIGWLLSRYTLYRANCQEKK